MEQVQRIHALNLVLKDEVILKCIPIKTPIRISLTTANVYIYLFIIWLQQYARSHWLLSGHYFLVMTGHYDFFSVLNLPLILA